MRLVCVVLSLLFGVTPAFAAPACSLAELAAVAETERRFSARAGEIGVRGAFLEYLSDDVVTFSDRIYVGKEQLRSQPAPTLPPRMILQCQGRAVSAAQDLAYTWGEYEVTSKDKPESGSYARVWQRHGRTWRIVLDVEAPRQ